MNDIKRYINAAEGARSLSTSAEECSLTPCFWGAKGAQARKVVSIEIIKGFVLVFGTSRYV